MLKKRMQIPKQVALCSGLQRTLFILVTSVNSSSSSQKYHLRNGEERGCTGSLFTADVTRYQESKVSASVNRGGYRRSISDIVTFPEGGGGSCVHPHRGPLRPPSSQRSRYAWTRRGRKNPRTNKSDVCEQRKIASLYRDVGFGHRDTGAFVSSRYALRCSHVTRYQESKIRVVFPRKIVDSLETPVWPAKREHTCPAAASKNSFARLARLDGVPRDQLSALTVGRQSPSAIAVAAAARPLTRPFRGPESEIAMGAEEE